MFWWFRAEELFGDAGFWLGPGSCALAAAFPSPGPLIGRYDCISAIGSRFTRIDRFMRSCEGNYCTELLKL